MSATVAVGVVLALDAAFGGGGAIYILVHHGATIEAGFGAIAWAALWGSGTDKLLKALKDARE